MKTKRVRKIVASVALLAGVGLWVSAAGVPVATAAEEAQAPAAAGEPGPTDGACWECIRDKDCDAICGGLNSGVCEWWNGCRQCLCKW